MGKESNVNLNQLNDRHQFEVFEKENFTDKQILKIKFNNIHFIRCDFTNTKISICSFNDDCLFSECNFTGTKFKGCDFNKTKIRECTFSGVQFMDVNIGDDCDLLNNSFSNDCITRNLKIRGEKIDDVTKLTSVVETNNETAGEQIEEQIEESYINNDNTQKELESRQNSEIDFKLYNVLFPQLLKEYSSLQKVENGYEITIDNVDFSISPDVDSDAWRYVFLVKDTDDSLGSDTIIVDTTQEITYDTLKEAFEQQIKTTVKNIADRTESQVIKNSLKKFTQEVFKDNNVITEALTSETVLVNIYDSSEDVFGNFTTGYDKVNKKTCVIIGKPFLTDNIAEGNRTREKVKQLGFVINDDILSMTEQELFDYAQNNPYSCFVYEHSDLMEKVNIRTFGLNQIVIIK